jgi:hypothetical protein
LIVERTLLLVRRPGILFSLVAIVLASVAGLSAVTAQRSGGGTGVNQPPLLNPTVKYIEKKVSVPKGDYRVINVNCPTGYVAIAGGFASSVGNVLGVANYPGKNRKFWVAGISNVHPQVRIASKLTGYATCAKAGAKIILPPADEGVSP